MSNQLEPVFLASCPFCQYRELFSSVLTMSAAYGAHLLGHERDGVQGTRFRKKDAAKEMERVAQHLRRLNTAEYN
jgi:hypothetical protein